jgi:CheY-like chemotaxis protein
MPTKIGLQQETTMTALRKVLVVDDDPVIGKSFHRVLTGKGYAVITAANGEEALNKLATEDYDLVYTDIKMPGMSGLEVAERVKADKPWMPVVIITGFGNAESEARARAAGATLLHKPLSPAMIEGSARDATAAAPALEAAPVETAKVETTVEPARRESVLKSIALFFAAPFIGLAYMIALPFVGGAMIAWFAAKAAADKYPAVRNAGLIAKHVGMLAAAPVIGLVSIVALPFVGLGALAWLGARALVEKRKTA